MHLHVLTGGDVQDAIAELRRRIRQHPQLLRQDDSPRQPDPQHVRAVFALFVNPLRHAEYLILRAANGSFLELGGHRLELFQILGGGHGG